MKFRIILNKKASQLSCKALENMNQSRNQKCFNKDTFLIWIFENVILRLIHHIKSRENFNTKKRGMTIQELNSIKATGIIEQIVENYSDKSYKIEYVTNEELKAGYIRISRNTMHGVILRDMVIFSFEKGFKCYAETLTPKQVEFIII